MKIRKKYMNTLKPVLFKSIYSFYIENFRESIRICIEQLKCFAMYRQKLWFRITCLTVFVLRYEELWRISTQWLRKPSCNDHSFVDLTIVLVPRPLYWCRARYIPAVVSLYNNFWAVAKLVFTGSYEWK